MKSNGAMHHDMTHEVVFQQYRDNPGLIVYGLSLYIDGTNTAQEQARGMHCSNWCSGTGLDWHCCAHAVFAGAVVNVGILCFL